MNDFHNLENIVAIIASILLVSAIFADCNNYIYSLIGLIPLSEAVIYNYVPDFSYRLNFLFGVLQVFVLLFIGSQPSLSNHVGLLNYLDVIAIFLMGPSLLMDKAKNVNHIFMFFIVLQQQRVVDEYADVQVRYMLKINCFLAFAFIGLSKIFLEDR
jgi:hypothetical protein